MQTRQTLFALGLAFLGLMAPVTAAQADPTTKTPVVASAAPGAITDVRIVAQEGSTRIQITGSSPFAPKISGASRTPAIITVPGQWHAGPAGLRRVGKNGIYAIRVGQFRAAEVRIVANGRGAQSWTTSASPDQKTWEIVLTPAGAKPAVTKAVAAPAPVTPAPTVRPVPLAATVRPGQPTVAAVLPRSKVAEAAPSLPIGEPHAATPSRPLAAVVKPVSAPVKSAPRPVVAAPVVRTTSTAVNAAVFQDPADKMVSLDFVGAEITDVLKAIQLQSGANIVAGPAVTGKVTVALKNIPLRQALDWVTRLSGFRFIYKDNTFVVGTSKEIALLERTSQMGRSATASISFFYAEGESLKTSITNVFPNVSVSLVTVSAEAKTVDANAQTTQPATPGTIQPAEAWTVRLTPRGGVLNVVGTVEEVEEVKKFVAATERSMVESSEQDIKSRSGRMAGYVTEVYDVKYVTPNELAAIIKDQVPGILMRIGPSQRAIGSPGAGSLTFGQQGGTGGAGGAGAAGGASGSTGGASGSTGGYSNDMQGSSSGGQQTSMGPGASQSNALLLTGTAEDVARAKEVAAKLDVRVPQLVFEAEIYDVNSDDLDNLGINYDFGRPVLIGEATPSGTNTGSGDIPARRLEFGQIFRTPYSVGLNLQALVKRGNAKVLARPKLQAQDNQSAMAFIGDQINYVLSIQQTAQGQNIQTQTATVGITLKVTGKYNGDGRVTLYVHPEVSTIASYLTVGNFALPQTSTRFVDTTVRVKDGEMIAIGGLVRTEDFNNRQYVPFLSQLPVIGKLFQSTNRQKRKSEVIVFLTARVLKD